VTGRDGDFWQFKTEHYELPATAAMLALRSRREVVKFSRVLPRQDKSGSVSEADRKHFGSAPERRNVVFLEENRDFWLILFPVGKKFGAAEADAFLHSQWQSRKDGQTIAISAGTICDLRKSTTDHSDLGNFAAYAVKTARGQIPEPIPADEGAS
jgi:hypothetical protein